MSEENVDTSVQSPEESNSVEQDAMAAVDEALETPSDMPEGDQSIEDKVDELLGDDEESEEDVEEEVEEESEESEKDKEIKELRKKLKLKVHGKEIEKELDWNDEDSIKRELQKSAAFDKVSQDFSQMKKQVGSFIQRLQENPGAVLAEMGLDVDKLSENHLQQRVEDMKKTPEEREKEEMRKQIEDYKQKLEAQEKARQEAEIEQMRNQYATEIESDITSALDSGKTTLPKSPLVIKRVAETMMLAMQQGFHDVSAADVLPVVEKQFKNELQEMFGVLPEDTLEALIGKNNLDRIRKKRVKKRNVQTKTARQVSKETGKVTQPEVEEQPKENRKFTDVFDWRS